MVTKHSTLFRLAALQPNEGFGGGGGDPTGDVGHPTRRAPLGHDSRIAVARPPAENPPVQWPAVGSCFGAALRPPGDCGGAYGKGRGHGGWAGGGALPGGARVTPFGSSDLRSPSMPHTEAGLWASRGGSKQHKIPFLFYVAKDGPEVAGGRIQRLTLNRRRLALNRRRLTLNQWTVGAKPRAVDGHTATLQLEAGGRGILQQTAWQLPGHSLHPSTADLPLASVGHSRCPASV